MDNIQIKCENVESIIKSNESFWQNQFNLAYDQFQTANNKRISKNRDIEQLKETLRRTLELNEEQERQIKDLKQQVEQLKKQIK